MIIFGLVRICKGEIAHRLIELLRVRPRRVTRWR
jgi:hypothetical protein